jgi:predicted DNA-binding transcriptional regulator AlpA
MSEHDDRRLFKPVEAAQFLGLSQSWLAKLRLTGDGPQYMKVGRQVRYSRADLMSWAEKSLRQNTSQMPNHDRRRFDPDCLQKQCPGPSQKETSLGGTELFFEYGRLVTRQHLFHRDGSRAVSLKAFLHPCMPDGAPAWRLATE